MVRALVGVVVQTSVVGGCLAGCSTAETEPFSVPPAEGTAGGGAGGLVQAGGAPAGSGGSELEMGSGGVAAGGFPSSLGDAAGFGVDGGGLGDALPQSPIAPPMSCTDQPPAPPPQLPEVVRTTTALITELAVDDEMMLARVYFPGGGTPLGSSETTRIERLDVDGRTLIEQFTTRWVSFARVPGGLVGTSLDTLWFAHASAADTPSVSTRVSGAFGPLTSDGTRAFYLVAADAEPWWPTLKWAPLSALESATEDPGTALATIPVAEPGLVAPLDMMTDGAYVYVAGTDVVRVDADSGESTVMLQGVHGPPDGSPYANVFAFAATTARRLAQDESTVYTTTAAFAGDLFFCAIQALPKDGAPPFTVATDLSCTPEIAVDDAFIYWLATDGLYRSPKDCYHPTLLAAPNPFEPGYGAALALHGDLVYFAHADRVLAVRR